MRRFLLALFFLFSFNYSYSQVILNELYTSPKTGLSEFFELYNTNTGAAIDLDCYSMVVYWEQTNGSKGFYVLDFPGIANGGVIGPLSFFVGSALGPDFGIQQCAKTTPNFYWSIVNGSNDASIKNYTWNGTTYTVTDLPDVEDFLTSNKNAVTGGFNYAVFLFNNGIYVNGFLGGHNSTNIPSSVTTMQPLTYSTNCGPKTINWNTITRAENVTENTGTDKNADNGFMRQGDGKCGEWVKASSPEFNTSTGACSNRNGEHSPGISNNTNGQSNVNDGFTLSTQTSVCGTRIDYAVTGVKTKGNISADEFFPFTVELYQDVNTNGILDANDLYISSQTISSVSSDFLQFQIQNISTTNKYLLVFQSQNLNCLEKIVTTDNVTLSTTEANFCGSQIDFTVNQANFSVGSNFTVAIYHDLNSNGVNDPGEPLFPGVSPNPVSGANIGKTRTFDIPEGSENLPYVIVYSSGVCNAVTRSGLTPVTTTLQTAQIYICGDGAGDVVTFSVQDIFGNTSGAAPLSVEIWADDDYDGEVNSQSDRLLETVTNVAVDQTYQRTVDQGGVAIILVYKTGRGCSATEFLLQECAPLPVNMGSFTALRNRNRVTLKWETLTEQNNRGFYVQRNTKGVWENRAFVFSAADDGNSTQPLTYTYNDDNNERGISQYRIQQVDLDSKFAYSQIRSVRGLEQAQRTVIYPNPSETGKVNVVFEEDGAKNVIVSDVSGRIVRQYRNVVNTLVVDKLDPGLYTFQIIDLSSQEKKVEKVIIMKR